MSAILFRPKSVKENSLNSLQFYPDTQTLDNKNKTTEALP